MSFSIRELAAEEFPPLLQEIPQPPTSLTLRGNLPPADMSLLAVVGSRKYSTYGKEVVEHLIGDLAGYNIGIVSGMALGVDGLAHEASLRYNLYTLAIPGGGLDDSVLYPASHKRLASQILEAGGGLLSEYEPTQRAAQWTFPKRNRLVTGMCHATLLIEAAEKSGTLITARMAVDYNRELLVVPGSIFSKNSQGVHQFLKLGATPVTNAADIVDVLGLDRLVPDKPKACPAATPAESTILQLLHEPLPTDDIVRKLKRPTHEVSVLLMEMELKGLVSQNNGLYRAVI